nr:hypothetical protein [Tanacetum cinerariifolium]
MMVMSAKGLLDWIMDSGCSYHMTPRYIPELKRNFISLETFEKEGYTIKLQSGKVKVINGSRVVLSGIRKDNYVYSLDGHVGAHELNASVEEKESLAQNGLAERMKRTLIDKELVDHPIGQKLVNCKRLFKIKESIKVVQKPRYKARAMLRLGLPSLCLKKEFDVKELEEAKKILGMEVVRDQSCKILRVSQSGYVYKILNNFRIDKGKSIQMPFGGHFKMSLKDCSVRDCDIERISKVSYANAIRSLMYLMVCTRPDIAYASTTNVGLVYGTNRGNDVDVTGFVDSDYTKDPDNGFLNKASMAKKKNNGDSNETSSLLSELAKKVKNIDGKMLGKDGKPLKPYRCVKWAEPPSVNSASMKTDDATSTDGEDGGSMKVRTSNLPNEYPNDNTIWETEAPLCKLQTCKIVKVLEGGPWFIKSKPIMLSIWSANTKMKREAMTKVPMIPSHYLESCREVHQHISSPDQTPQETFFHTSMPIPGSVCTARQSASGKLDLARNDAVANVEYRFHLLKLSSQPYESFSTLKVKGLTLQEVTIRALTTSRHMSSSATH